MVTQKGPSSRRRPFLCGHWWNRFPSSSRYEIKYFNWKMVLLFFQSGTFHVWHVEQNDLHVCIPCSVSGSSIILPIHVETNVIINFWVWNTIWGYRRFCCFGHKVYATRYLPICAKKQKKFNEQNGTDLNPNELYLYLWMEGHVLWNDRTKGEREREVENEK